MKKKMIAMLLATAMVASCSSSVVFAAKEDAKTETAAEDEKAEDDKAEAERDDAEKDDDEEKSDSKDTDKEDSKDDAEETKEELPYAPKEDYDEYALVDYEIESLGQELEIVVCKKDGDKEYNLQMFFFGGDADVDVTYDDNGECKVTNDGGFFQTEGPLVVEKAEKEGNWKKVADYGKDDAGKEDGEKFDVSTLDYQPKADYDKFTVTDFEMESLGQDLEIVVSAMDDEKSFNLQMFFFGGDADINVTVDDDGNYEVTNDSGFFQTEGPLVVQQVLEEDNWQAIEK